MLRLPSRRVTKAIVGLIAAGVVIGMWFYGEHTRAVAVHPDGVTTVRDFTRRFGEPQSTFSMTVSGVEYFELTFYPGRFGLEFPAGAAAYVFDSAGRLFDWTPNSAEDSDFQQRWLRHPRRPIDVRSVPVPPEHSSA